MIALAAASFLMFGCETNVAVDSSANPVGCYNLTDGIFKGEIAGSPTSVFKAANAALEKDLGFMCTGFQPKDPLKQKIKARMRDDRLVVVTMTQVEPGLTAVEIDVDDSDLMTSHKIFNAIARRSNKR